MTRPSLSNDPSSKKILVVDDDPDIGSMIKMMLEFKGYEATGHGPCRKSI